MIASSLGLRRSEQRRKRSRRTTRVITTLSQTPSWVQQTKHRASVAMSSRRPKDAAPATHIVDEVYLGGSPTHHASFSAAVCLQEEHETSALYPVFPHLLRLPTPDFASPSWLQIDAAMAFLNAHRNERVLIHCKSGIGRSAVVATVCVALRRQMSLREAHAYVRRRRRISPLSYASIPNPQWTIAREYVKRKTGGGGSS